MKNKKMRFIALAMSALMVTSSVPSVAFAEEDVIISEEAGAEVIAAAEEAGVTVEAVEEEAADTVEVNGASTVNYVYNADTGVTFKFEDNVAYASYDLIGSDGKTRTVSLNSTKNSVQGDTEEGWVSYTTSPADCVNAEGHIIKVSIPYVNSSTKTDAGIIASAPIPDENGTKAYHHGLSIEDYTTIKTGADDDKLANNAGGLSADVLVAAGFTKKSTTITKYPTCVDTGTMKVTYECRYCHETTFVTEIIDATGHEMLDQLYYVAGENIVKDKDGYVVFKDGKAQLLDENSDGIYTIVKHCKEYSTCEEEELVETVTVPAVTTKAAYIIASENISKVNVNGELKTIDEIKEIAFEPADIYFSTDLDKIYLTDCTKDGSYTVQFVDAAGKPQGKTVKFTVAAHHVTYVVANISADDTEIAKATYSDDHKSVTVSNKSCNKTVTYAEETWCYAEEKKIASVNKTVEPSDDNHLTSDTAKTAIKTVVTSEGAELTYDDLLAVAEENKKTISLGKNTSDCENAGIVEVNYLCTVCGKVAATETIKVAARGHVEAEAVAENIVKATCTSEGSWEAVVYCARGCGKEYSRVKHTFEKLDHTYEAIALQATPATTDATAKVIDVAGYLLDKTGKLTKNQDEVVYIINSNSKTVYIGNKKAGGQVAFTARRQCTVCGEVESSSVLDGTFSVEIVKVTKEDEKGQGGSIQLKATYTYEEDNETKSIDTGIVTYPYYSTETSYSGRTETNEVVKNGLVKDEDGVYRYYEGGKLSDETGIIYYEGGRFLIENGVLASERNGLYLNVADQKWYYLSGGQVRTDVEVAPYNGSYFYLTNGVVDTTKNGLVPFAGGQFLFAGGQIQINVDGLWCDPSDGTWYYLAGGQRQTQHTGVVFYDGAAFYVEAGKLAVDYNGTVQYNGATFKVVGGQLY